MTYLIGQTTELNKRYYHYIDVDENYNIIGKHKDLESDLIKKIKSGEVNIYKVTVESMDVTYFKMGDIFENEDLNIEFDGLCTQDNDSDIIEEVEIRKEDQILYNNNNFIWIIGRKHVNRVVLNMECIEPGIYRIITYNQLADKIDLLTFPKCIDKNTGIKDAYIKIKDLNLLFSNASWEEVNCEGELLNTVNSIGLPAKVLVEHDLRRLSIDLDTPVLMIDDRIFYLELNGSKSNETFLDAHDILRRNPMIEYYSPKVKPKNLDTITDIQIEKYRFVMDMLGESLTNFQEKVLNMEDKAISLELCNFDDNNTRKVTSDKFETPYKINDYIFENYGKIPVDFDEEFSEFKWMSNRIDVDEQRFIAMTIIATKFMQNVPERKKITYKQTLDEIKASHSKFRVYVDNNNDYRIYLGESGNPKRINDGVAVLILAYKNTAVGYGIFNNEILELLTWENLGTHGKVISDRFKYNRLDLFLSPGDTLQKNNTILSGHKVENFVCDRLIRALSAYKLLGYVGMKDTILKYMIHSDLIHVIILEFERPKYSNKTVYSKSKFNIDKGFKIYDIKTVDKITDIEYKHMRQSEFRQYNNGVIAELKKFREGK